MACLCGNKTFSIELKAFVNSVTIDENGAVIDFKKDSVELDLDTYNEFCYCTKCGSELEYASRETKQIKPYEDEDEDE